MERRKLWKDEKQGLTFCHTKTIMKMWRNKNRYGEDRKTKVGQCKKESIEYPIVIFFRKGNGIPVDFFLPYKLIPDKGKLNFFDDM